MNKLEEKDKHLLTRCESRISFLYIEKARIEQTDYSVEIVQGEKSFEIPITTINCLMLGPGVTVTHRAIANITAAGCSICWVGEGQNVFYAYGEPTTNKSKNILAQIRYHEDKRLHMDVVRRMYSIRYPTARIKTKTAEELRGIEGTSVRNLYESLSEKCGVKWEGRKYRPGDFEGQDVVNRYLTALNQRLYAICQGVICALGFSCAVGFIHTGHMLSFVYDIADLYKEEVTIPLAFELARKNHFDREEMTKRFREEIVNKKLMQRIANDTLALFDATKEGKSIEVGLRLWDGKKFAESGKNYSRGVQKA